MCAKVNSASSFLASLATLSYLPMKVSRCALPLYLPPPSAGRDWYMYDALLVGETVRRRFANKRKERLFKNGIYIFFHILFMSGNRGIQLAGVRHQTQAPVCLPNHFVQHTHIPNRYNSVLPGSHTHRNKTTSFTGLLTIRRSVLPVRRTATKYWVGGYLHLPAHKPIVPLACEAVRLFF